MCLAAGPQPPRSTRHPSPANLHSPLTTLHSPFSSLHPPHSSLHSPLYELRGRGCRGDTAHPLIHKRPATKPQPPYPNHPASTPKSRPHSPNHSAPTHSTAPAHATAHLPVRLFPSTLRRLVLSGRRAPRTSRGSLLATWSSRRTPRRTRRGRGLSRRGAPPSRAGAPNDKSKRQPQNPAGKRHNDKRQTPPRRPAVVARALWLGSARHATPDTRPLPHAQGTRLLDY